LKNTDTASAILDVAQWLVQTRGFNGFSYADISDELGIRKASIHHHFPTKALLGQRLIERYQQVFVAALEQIESESADSVEMLRRYAELYVNVLASDNRMCLCGMFAADFGTLPTPLQEQVKAFFVFNEVWLQRVLEHGRRAAELQYAGPSRDEAKLFLSSLQGSMMVARSFGDVARFQVVAQRLIDGFAPSTKSRRRPGKPRPR
jgi:TetR/AcrR family transcriptional regulator, transcriptional repressor for nem operon